MEFRVVGFSISIANVSSIKELVKRNIGKKLSSKGVHGILFSIITEIGIVKRQLVSKNFLCKFHGHFNIFVHLNALLTGQINSFPVFSLKPRYLIIIKQLSKVVQSYVIQIMYRTIRVLFHKYHSSLVCCYNDGQCHKTSMGKFNIQGTIFF